MAGPNLRQSITAGVTTGEVADTLLAYKMLNRFDDVAVTNGFGLVGVGGLWTATPVYPQRRWVSGAWEARPAVPSGVVVTCYSTVDIDATPPTSNVTGDIWLPHPDSVYWPV